MNYARGEIGIRSIAPAMAENIKTIMQTQTLTEVETAQLMGVLEEIVGDAGLAEAYVSSAIDGQAESGYNDTKDIQNFKFNKYLRKEVGDPPADMVNPHAHHILFKEGLGPAQKALVKEGQALLRRYGIDPIWGLENLVWAPNRIVGQHDIEALRKVVEKLKLVEDFGGSYNDIVEALEVLGEIAAERRK
jgi:hypothetical protein